MHNFNNSCFAFVNYILLLVVTLAVQNPAKKKGVVELLCTAEEVSVAFSNYAYKPK